MKTLMCSLFVICSTIVYAQQIHTIVSKISTGNDDAEVASNYLYFYSSDLELGGYDTENSGKQSTMLRFRYLSLPANAIVRKAYIQFTSKSGSSKTANLVIKCQEGNASAYTSLRNIKTRTYVNNIVKWNPPAWTRSNQSDINQRTPDLSTLINAAISTGWRSRGSLSFKIEGDASVDNVLNARSYEYGVGMPKLIIEYQLGNPCAVDMIPPVFSNCPDNLSLSTLTGSAIANWTNPIVSDNCTQYINPSLSTVPTEGLSNGSTFPIGTTKVTYNAIDAAKNKASPCSFTVTVTNSCKNEVILPVISNCPTNINLTTTGSTALATWTLPTVSDNCTQNITPSVSTAPTAGLDINSAFPTGITTVTYSAKDAANNIATPCIFTVTVTNPCDNEAIPPVISNCPTNLNLTTTGSTAVGTWTLPTVSDNCTQNITPSVSTAPTAGLDINSAFPTGITTVTYSAKDAANNIAIPCIFTVTVTNPCDNEAIPPVISNCPTNLNLTTTGSTAVGTWTLPTVSDNCTQNITASVSTAPTAGLDIGSAFPTGTTTVTYSAQDAALNNATPCRFDVIVVAEKKITYPIDKIFINEVAPKGTISNSEDWIELYNDNDSEVSTDSLFITGKKSSPFKWRLKGLTIPAKGFLVLIADKDTLKGLNHIDMKLSADGESVYLFRQANGAAVQMAAFTFPALAADEDNVTFGVNTEGGVTPAPAALTKFLGGTIGASNITGKRFLRVSNNLPRGIITTNTPTTITLTAPAGATIRYTTDHAIPSRTVGIIYTTPITFDTTSVIKTFAYLDNGESVVESFTYIYLTKGSELTFPDLVSQTEYEQGLKQLPIVSISTNVGVIDSKDEKICSVEYINKFGENKSTSAVSGIAGYGNFSYIFSDQKNLRLSFKNKYGFPKFRYPIFKKDDVDTYAPTDKFDKLELKIGQDGPNAVGFGMVMTSQGLISKTMRELGNIDIHTQYVHAFVNGKYHGIYILKEKYDEKFAAEYYGGEDKQYDVLESLWPGAIVNAGTINNWNALVSAASQNQFQEVKKYLNVNQLTDWMMTMMYFDNEWEFRAVADKNLLTTKFVLENHDTDGALVKISEENEFTYDKKWSDPSLLLFQGPGGIFGNLYSGKNKEFITLVRDRVYEAFQKKEGALTVGRITTKLNELKDVIRPVFNMELARFNKTFYNNNPYFDEEYDKNIAHLPIRFQYNLDKWLEKGLIHTLLPPTFNQPSGKVTTPVLAINPNSTGMIYYTIDGSDPMGNDGIVNPLANLYTDHLALHIGVNKVVARVFANGEFGPKTMATYTSEIVVSSLQIAQILTVEAKINGQKGSINWISRTSQIPDYFKIEKANKIGNFEPIQVVNALFSNKRDGIEAYDWTDENLSEGDNMYRVALISDILKTPQYSEIVHLNYHPADNYALFPNPASDFIDINLASIQSKEVKISIFNTMGKQVLFEKIDNAPANKRLDLGKLESGQYFISIEPEGKKKVMKKLSIMR